MSAATSLAELRLAVPRLDAPDQPFAYAVDDQRTIGT